MSEKQATRASHSIGVARTLLDLALDYYEGVANLGAADLFQGSSVEQRCEEECDARIASVRAWVNAIEAGIACDAEEDEEDFDKHHRCPVSCESLQDCECR